jgi:prophage regulatory protein
MSTNGSEEIESASLMGQPTDHESRIALLAFSDLAGKGIPFTRQHVARLIKGGRFPAPIKLGIGTNRWIASEIDSWLSQRKAERDAALESQRRDR